MTASSSVTQRLCFQSHPLLVDVAVPQCSDVSAFFWEPTRLAALANSAIGFLPHVFQRPTRLAPLAVFMLMSIRGVESDDDLENCKNKYNHIN